MINQFVKKLVFLIKEKVTPGVTPVNFLMDVLSTSKETAYRRLRGEIVFSFDEVIKIAKKLGVSLDEIADMDEWEDKSNWVKFNFESLNSPLQDLYTDVCYENLRKFADSFLEMGNTGNSIFRSASISIPYYFLMHYEKLSLFRYYKWIYLTQPINRDFTFDKIDLLPCFLQVERDFVGAFQQIAHILCIIDRDIFHNMVKDIIYFFNQNLITREELIQLKAELLDLVSFMESLTETGRYKDGGQIDIYLADVNMDSTYGHFENNVKEYSVNMGYFVDVIVYDNKKMCHKQKLWIELLKRYSTHITQTGEKERYEFFRKQREMIEHLL